MKINTELKTLLENLYPKYTLLKICQQLDIDFPSNLKELSYLNKEDITTNLLTHTSESELLSTLKKFPTSAHSSFIGTSYVIKNRMIIKENGYKKLILSLNKINNNNPLIVKKLLKLILELNGSINTNIIKIYFKNKSTIITEVLEKLVKERILEKKYDGELYQNYEIPKERIALLLEYTGNKKNKGIILSHNFQSDEIKDILTEEKIFITESENILLTFVKGIKTRIDETVSFGETLSIKEIELYLKKLLGNALYFDGLLTLAQQCGLSETPIVTKKGDIGMKCGVNLALFGDPGTGKSFTTRDLLFGSTSLNLPPHGIPGINRYAGGMTSARFIRIGQAYQGKTFNFVVPEFNDWFRTSGMVEPLKLAMEGGTIQYEMHREVIGPYDFSSYFVVNYNTAVGDSGFRATVRDPNFRAIEDRMICRLHRMTKERYIEISTNQMRLLQGESQNSALASKIRDILTLIYAIQKGISFDKKYYKPKNIILSQKDMNDFLKVRDAIMEHLPKNKINFSVRLERNALILASSLSLLTYFQKDDIITIDKNAKDIALRFYIEEASIRAGEIFDAHKLIDKLGFQSIR